ncbi:hypothetical protein BD324DRAFT_647934 [Kockovaella imperatae]|uniref:DUF1308 domain-containing protein n=1 Tax=Kockovaella imperatae TaxID=4999 RepID=A0A1Y1UUB9_9TREE|nr:hypothetical protein BD324DRAFT_647934 [Kockovaella imperatae]ORX41036.1 hypothetical protein BD324DRAFT_647934 [Kockovaella imperatae]
MQEVVKVRDELEQLCIDIRTFQKDIQPTSLFKAPVIDHFHPNNYSQKAIAGLRKFLDAVEAERDHVAGIVASGVAPENFTTNAPNQLAIWSEFCNAKWPIVSIGLFAGGASRGQNKIDIVADGGNEWIKVNTIKETRLVAEFREQDSYINSDYDSEEDEAPTQRDSLSNSILRLANSLSKAAEAEERPVGLPRARVRLILNRMEEKREEEYLDVRIPETFRAISDSGVLLELGTRGPRQIPPLKPPRRYVPSKAIVLDLSVVIALCCDSTHRPLPATEEELEGRFRAMCLNADGDKDLEPHSNVTKDLRDQLRWESQRPLAQELDDRLSEAGYAPNTLEFWVTQEVKDRIPGIIDVIGGPAEKARASALLEGPDSAFWHNSRHEGRLTALKTLRVRTFPDSIASSPTTAAREPPRGLPAFEIGLWTACMDILGSSEVESLKDKNATKIKNLPKRSRNPRRPKTVFHATTKAPSSHTLRTVIAGIEHGMTVLTNNRGAIGKLISHMGVYDGFPEDRNVDETEARLERRAAIWVVNPSSLSEWRRIQVEERNAAFSI